MTEWLDIVDTANSVIGSAPHDAIYKNKHNHRIAHVMLFDRNGNVALQLRSKHKSFLPGCWTTAVGGHVRAGETPYEAALRETHEELGVRLELRVVGEMTYEVEPDFLKFLTVYEATYDGPFSHDPQEVECVTFFPVARCVRMLENKESMHPELAAIVQHFYSATFT